MEEELNVIEARDLLKSDKNVRLIDVRTSDEFERGAIKGSINIPLSRVSQEIPDLDFRNINILVCADGSQSQNALQLFTACGFKAHFIRGGLKDWAMIVEPSLADKL